MVRFVFISREARGRLLHFFAPANFPRKVAAVRATPHSETGGGTQLKQCPNSASYTSTGKAKTVNRTSQQSTEKGHHFAKAISAQAQQTEQRILLALCEPAPPRGDGVIKDIDMERPSIIYRCSHCPNAAHVLCTDCNETWQKRAYGFHETRT